MKYQALKFFAIVLGVVSMAFTSCNDTDDPESVSTEYAFNGCYHILSSIDDEDYDLQSETIELAYKNAGIPTEDFSLILTGDSTDVSKLLKEKMMQVEKELQSSPVEINATVYVAGAEKQYVNADDDKQHPIVVWHKINLGTPENADVGASSTYASVCGFRFIKSFRNEKSNCKNICKSTFGINTNYDHGGWTIFLCVEYSGIAPIDDYDKHYFEWEDSYTNQYITDVIGIYGGGEPNTIKIDGRTYKKQQGGYDLNKGASGAYVYLYTTSDPVPGNEGFYLNTGYKDGNSQTTGICNISAKGYFKASDYLPKTVVKEGHEIRYRVVQAYYHHYKDGKPERDPEWAGELDTNKGSGGYYIRLIMPYASRYKVK